MVTRKELFKKDFARIRRKIDKYNEQLSAYIRETGDDEVPEIDSTVIGTSPMSPIEYKESRRGIMYCDDGWWDDITVEEECGEYWVSGEEMLDDLLKHNRRRLRFGMRVWKSNNPDAVMEEGDDNV